MLSSGYISKEQFLSGLTKDLSDQELKFYQQFLAHISDDDLSKFKTHDLEDLLNKSWNYLSQKENIRILATDNSTEFYIINDDRPFIVNSITSLFYDLEYELDFIIHPVLTVERDSSGKLLNIFSYDKRKKHESFVYISIKCVLSEYQIQELHNLLRQVFEDLVQVVEDWASMKLLTHVLEHSAFEVQSFLKWAEERYFVFLGACESINGSITSRLGFSKLVHLHQDIENLISSLIQVSTPPIGIFKIPQKSTIYSRMPIDVIILHPEKDRHIIFFGLFTVHAHAQAALTIPLVREKCQHVLDRSGFEPHWHDSKELIRIFESLPRDDLFQMSEKELFSLSMGLVQLQKSKSVSVFLREDPLGKILTVLIYIRTDRYSSKMQKDIEKLLEDHIYGVCLSSHVQMGDLFYVRLQILMEIIPGKTYCFDEKGIEEKIFQLTQSWEEQFFGKLGYIEDIQFSLNYQEKFSPEQGVEDLTLLLSDQDFKGDFIEHNDQFILKLFNENSPLNLSDIFPILDKMGLYIILELSQKIVFKGSIYYLHLFYLRLPQSVILNPDTGKNVIEMISLILKSEVKNDRLNELLLTAGLLPRQTLILRAYTRYIKQIQPIFSAAFVEEILVKYPQFTKLFIDFFHEKFSPELFHRQIEEKLFYLRRFLKNITSAEEDKVLNLLINLLESTLRNNYYQDSGTKDYISLKFDSLKILGLPLPRPWREIFVYSLKVEGIHMRFGKIARGGIRWSDRRVDYRMEVLSLVKAQQVKNTIIVPTGSKGGFFVKTTAGRAPTLEEGIAAYKILIRGLLDLTDNIVSEKILKPVDVVCYDEDDPYLVVAADKGTASFSDIANSLSLEYNFWLQDAFASGGSQGYDHKKLGITSKGAWESVKHHFDTLNIDIENDSFMAVGVGDMSGDVFGNGMLLSQKLKLIAAFDHRDIFIDPSPDLEVSYDERKRLFDLPRSSWQDYDRKLISQGGGVFSRQDKAIGLTEESKQLLELEGDSFTSDEIIRAILKFPADLMWFGGIGTYIKATDEVHADAKDPANNDLRINGSQIRAKIIAEGANLGMTQKGRIEYVLNGGLLNTDSVDNCAGVNCSDHEVNIKILLSRALEAGEITLEERDEILKTMSKDVVAHVLQSNFDQPRSITKTYLRGSSHLPVIDFMIRFFQDQKILDPRLESMPSYQVIQDCYSKNIGLTRPDLSILLAFTKIFLKPHFLDLEILKTTEFETILFSYFPKKIQEKFPNYILSHPLRQELIVTLVLNEIVNDLGLDVAFNLYMHFSAKMDQFIYIYYLLKRLEISHDVAIFLNLEKLSPEILEKMNMAKNLEIIPHIFAYALQLELEYSVLEKNYLLLKNQIPYANFKNLRNFSDVYILQKLNQDLEEILIKLALKKIEGSDIRVLSDHPILRDVFMHGSGISEMVILLNHLKGKL